ncbi:MAG: hypothetical protein IT324_19050 [Anaerolineae bacterium]|nr:hypothetical protein [Anaerolineae bacterium]
MRELTWNECDAVSGATDWSEAYQSTAKLGGTLGTAAGAAYAVSSLSISELFTTAGAALLGGGAASGAIIGAAAGIAGVTGYSIGTGVYSVIDVYLLDGMQFVLSCGGF